MKKIFLVASVFIITCCNAQDNRNVLVTINSRNNYYFKENKLMARVLAKDSISFEYKDTLLVKVEKYKEDKFISKAVFVYDSNNEISENYIFTEDYYDYYEKFHTKIPYNNKYKLLDRDFVYIDAVLDKVLNWNKYSNGKKAKKVFEFKLNRNVRMLNAKFSPFIYGAILKKIKLYVVNNFLVEIEATLLEEPDRKIFYYKKIYEYDKFGRLSFTKTINLTSGEIEDLEKIEYKNWQ